LNYVSYFNSTTPIFLLTSVKLSEMANAALLGLSELIALKLGLGFYYPLPEETRCTNS